MVAKQLQVILEDTEEGVSALGDVAVQMCIQMGVRPLPEFGFGQVFPVNWSEAGEMYWCTDIPNKEIAVAYGIKGGPSAIWQSVGPGVLCGILCASCDGYIIVRSRSHAQQALSTQSNNITCEECDKAAHRQWLRELRFKEQAEREHRRHLKYMPYRDYLKTDHWQDTRKMALRRAGYRCQLCNGARPLQVHHRTYERRGSEWPEDLIALCGDCHGEFHQKLTLDPAGTPFKNKSKPEAVTPMAAPSALDGLAV